MKERIRLKPLLKMNMFAVIFTHNITIVECVSQTNISQLAFFPTIKKCYSLVSRVLLYIGLSLRLVRREIKSEAAK